MLKKITVAAVIALFLVGCGSSKKSYPSGGSSSSSSTSSTSSSSSSSSSTSSSSTSSSSSSGDPIVATCNASEFQQPAEIQLEALVPDNTFVRPTSVTFLPGNDDVMFVLQQDGVIWRLDYTGSKMKKELFVDLRDYYNVVFLPEGPGGCHECGLYSMAFHPDFAENGYFYLSFTEDGDPGNPLQSYVARFRSDDGGQTIVRKDSGYPWREDLYHVQQPTRIHNNGQVKFGPDDFLYVSFGDGGPGQDPDRNSQNVNNPFGSILRLQDDGTPAPGNLVEGGLPEIYAHGLRNPWHWSFDRETGQLWLGDVGQAQVEEVNIIENGGNYGWRCYEGNRPYLDCGSDGPFTSPIWDYSHEEGRSVTGGYVYRGEALPGLYGTYIFGDFGSGLIWALFEEEDGQYHRASLLSSGKYISAFSEDSEGELYVIDYAGGSVHRIAAAEANPNLIPLPEKLSATGCVSGNDVTQPAEKVVPYSINETFWSDNAEKERFFVLPEGQEIEVEDNGSFTFPIGSVLIKNFRLDGRLIETRLLLNQSGTGWSGFSYEWNEEQTEANLLEEGKDVEIGSQVWRYPGRAECSQCHTAAAGFSLGPEVSQLNREHTYGNGQTVNQLDYLENNGMLAKPLTPKQRQVSLKNSSDTTADLEARALSYLHANCSGCHRPGGTTQAGMDFQLHKGGTAFMNACEQEPLQSDLGITGAKLLVPGDHSRSLIWQRLMHEGEYRMPPVGSNVLDVEGANLIADWIDSLEGCSTVVGPENATYVIRSKSTDEALIANGDGLALSGTTASLSWALESWDGFYRLQSADEPNHYMHVEGLTLSLTTIQDNWWSANWEIEVSGDYFRIRNRWQGDSYLYVAPNTGELRFGPIVSGTDAALWSFEIVQ